MFFTLVLSKSDLYNINELQNPGTGIDLCRISYIHFIYTDKIYEIKVQNLNCGTGASTIALGVL